MSTTFFETEVLQASHQQPVLVDFWAEWCGPCRMIGPVLEKLESEASGRWKLVKLNTEEHPDVAAMQGISSIPAVKLFVNGAVQDEFVGALPESHVRAFLQRNLPDPAEVKAREAEKLLNQGDEAQALALLEEAHRLDGDSTRITALLARATLFSSPERARTLAQRVVEGQLGFEIAAPVAILAGLDDHEAPGDGASEGQNAAWKHYRRGVDAFHQREFGTAAEAWLESLRRSRSLNDDAAKDAAIALFNLLGEDHPVTQEYRRQLASAMF